MPSPEEWAEALPIDTSEDVHVTCRTDGVYLFYTEEPEAYVRTDHVVDVEEWR